MMTRLKAFFSDDSGVISTEWLVLTAAAIAFSPTIAGFIASGAEAASTEMSTVIETSMPADAAEARLSATFETHEN